MKIFVKVKTKAKSEKVEKTDRINFRASVKEAPEKGKANGAVVRLLANYFNVSQSQINIISGSTSKLKIIEIV